MAKRVFIDTNPIIYLVSWSEFLVKLFKDNDLEKPKSIKITLIL